jgi:hypothetical protein
MAHVTAPVCHYQRCRGLVVHIVAAPAEALACARVQERRRGTAKLAIAFIVGVLMRAGLRRAVGGARLGVRRAPVGPPTVGACRRTEPEAVVDRRVGVALPRLQAQLFQP